MKKWFKKISNLFKIDDSLKEKMLNLIHKSYEHKISFDTYKKLMYDHEIFHFDNKDWIIFNVYINWEEIDLADCVYSYQNIKLKLRSIEDDPRMTIELDLSANEFEKIIDINKYINEEDKQ